MRREREIFEKIFYRKLFDEEEAWYADAVAHRIQGPPHRTLGELSRLELEGALRRDAGGAYRRS